MAAGQHQQLKKLRKQLSLNQQRGGNGVPVATGDVKGFDYNDYDDHGSRPIEILPKHWSVYALMFSSVTIVVLCFLLFDFVSSPAPWLPRNGATGLQQQLGGLGAQVGGESEHDDGSVFEFSRPRSWFSRGSEAQQALVDDVDVRGAPDPSLLRGQLVSEFLKGKDSSSPPGHLQPSRREGIPRPSAVEERKNKEDVAQGRDLDGIDVVEEDKFNKSEQEKSEKDNAAGKLGGKKDSAILVAKETNSGEKSDSATPSETALIEEARQEKRADDKRSALDSSSGVKNAERGLEGDNGNGKGHGTEKSKIEDETSKSKQGKNDGVKALSTPCDYSVGKWIHDENYPLYPPNSCPYIDPGFRCVENGRPSVEFQKWRWQPSMCHIPRWDAKAMLERMRGLRMAFVGDSLGRNSWESLMCMLADAVPDSSRLYPLKGQNITKYAGSVTFRFEDYNFTVEYYRSTHLVLSVETPSGSRSDPEVQSILRVDKIDNSSSTWRDADIVIFNTGHWWTLEKTMHSGTYFQRGKSVEKNMEVRLAFKLAMRTVARFVEQEMNPAKTQVFFMSYAPHHFKGGKWNDGGSCNEDTKPIMGFPFVYEDKTCNNMILEMMGANVKHPVNFLNITYISDLRPDGHNSIWRTYPPLPMDIQDCSHWCLPGVPETWNEILFASLMDIGKGSWRKSKQLLARKKEKN